MTADRGGDEPRTKLYRASCEFEAASVDEARGKLRKIDPGLSKALTESLERVTKGKYSSRADRLSEAEALVDEARGIVEELRGEVEEWRENLPENLQGGQKADELEQCASTLEEIEQALEDANFSGVEFPGMY